MSENTTCILVDNSFALEVNKEDSILVRELIRHYTPRLVSAEEKAEEKGSALASNILAIFKKNSIEARLLEFSERVNVLGTSAPKSGEPAAE